MKLLALDCATEHCSAVCWDGRVLASRETPGSQSASAELLAMIQAVLAEAGASLATVQAIAFGRGPGGFTGVRLAASITQGLAFAAGKPVLPVSNLRAVAWQAAQIRAACERVLVCQDARMGEVYWGAYECRGGDARLLGLEAVGRPAGVSAPPAWHGLAACGAGSGFAAYPELAAGVHLLPDCRSHAAAVAALAECDGLASALPAEQALPVYLRDDVAIVPAS